MKRSRECPVTHFDHLDRVNLGGRWKQNWTGSAAACPVIRSDGYEPGGFFVLTKYRDIMYVLRHPEVFSSYPITIPPLEARPRRMIPLETDPPMHRKYRAPITEYFSKSAQARREPLYRDAAAGLIARIADRGECDLAKEVCWAFPILAIMTMLGIDEAEREQVASGLSAMGHPPGDSIEPGRAAELAQQTANALGILLSLAQRRRAHPGSDLISLLCTVEIDGRPLDDDEIVDYAVNLCLGGFDTTASALAYSFLFLSQNTGIRGKLVADPLLIPDFIEEIMRFEQPSKGLARTVMTEVELSGVTFSPGDRILLLFAAGNRDPEAFSEPGQFVLGRSPNRHLGFGAGPHVCVGIHMARLEMKVVFEEFLARVPDFNIDPASVIEAPGPTFVVSAMRATWTPTRPRPDLGTPS
jgi:cytochrome P450